MESAENPLKNFITLDEVTERYGRSRSFWYKKTAAREIDHFKFGKTLLFDPAVVEEFVRPRPVKAER